MVCALGACAGQSIRPDDQWNAYRAQVEHDEQAGVLSASQAQRRLWDGWVNIYGQDATMNGYSWRWILPRVALFVLATTIYFLGLAVALRG